MKVERVDPEEQFVPVRITLESKEEADFMYFMLNTGIGMSLEKRCKELGYDLNFLGVFNEELWKKFRKQHGTEWRGEKL